MSGRGEFLSDLRRVPALLDNEQSIRSGLKYSLPIPSGAIELANGLVHVVDVAVIETAAKSKAGMGGRSRIPILGKIQERRYLSSRFKLREKVRGENVGGRLFRIDSALSVVGVMACWVFQRVIRGYHYYCNDRRLWDAGKECGITLETLFCRRTTSPEVLRTVVWSKNGPIRRGAALYSAGCAAS